MTNNLGDRSKYIGASDISTILGISPWTSPYKLWTYKTKRDEPEENDFMTRGKLLEPQAREIYIEQLGIEVNIEPTYIYEEWPIAVAHPDGINLDGDIIIEIKCPVKPATVDLYNISGIPKHYYVQCQWQLMCSGAEVCHFFAWHPDTEPAFIEIYPDVEYFKIMLSAAKEFWHFVENDIAPPTTERDYVKIEDREFENYAIKYIKLLEQEQELRKQKDEVREHILEFTDDGNCYGAGLKIFKSMPKKIIDWKSLCNEYKIDDEKKKPFVKYGNSFYTIRKEK